MQRKYTIKQYVQTYYNGNNDDFAYDACISKSEVEALIESGKVVIVEQGKHTLLDSEKSELPVIPFNVHLKRGVACSILCFSYGVRDFEIELSEVLQLGFLFGDERLLNSLEVEFIGDVFDSVVLRIDSKFEIAVVNNDEVAYHSGTGDYRLVQDNDDLEVGDVYVTVEDAIQKAEQLNADVFFDELPVWICQQD